MNDDDEIPSNVIPLFDPKYEAEVLPHPSVTDWTRSAIEASGSSWPGNEYMDVMGFDKFGTIHFIEGDLTEQVNIGPGYVHVSMDWIDRDRTEVLHPSRIPMTSIKDHVAGCNKPSCSICFIAAMKVK